MTGTTPGDGLRFPDDYSQPADSPNAFQQLANDTQTALNKRLTPTTGQHGLSAVEIGPGAAGAAETWEVYRPITTVTPGWQGFGAWLELAQQNRAGVWVVDLMIYADVTGGTTLGVGVWAGIHAKWASGAAASTEAPLTGRLTMGKGQSAVATLASRVRITNNTGARLRLRPAGQLGSALPAGADAQLGYARMSAAFVPAPAAIATTGYAPSNS